jgi:hypothetical protein
MWPSKRKLDEEKSDIPVWLSKIVLARIFPRDAKAGKRHSKA